MEETGRREIGPVEKQPLTGFLIELPDTPKNQAIIGRLAERLTTLITSDRANIAFGVGLRGGKVALKAENLDLVTPGMERKSVKR